MRKPLARPAQDRNTALSRAGRAILKGEGTMADRHFSTIERDFGDGRYTFALPYHLVVELEKLRDCGPMVLLNRLQTNTWSIEDIKAVIRLGLIGGGTDPLAALKLVRVYVEQRPALENLPLAFMILAKGITGAQEPANDAGNNVPPADKTDSNPNGETVGDGNNVPPAK